MFTLYTLFKFLHVAAVTIWLGGAATLTLLNFRLSRVHQPDALQVLTKESSFYGAVVVGPAATLTLLAGIVTALRHRFLRATTQRHIGQVERAQWAAALLQQGATIADTVFEAGYFDQPHLTRSLKQFIGYTPAQLMPTHKAEPLAVSYKTARGEATYPIEVASIR